MRRQGPLGMPMFAYGTGDMFTSGGGLVSYDGGGNVIGGSLYGGAAQDPYEAERQRQAREREQEALRSSRYRPPVQQVATNEPPPTPAPTPQPTPTPTPAPSPAPAPPAPAPAPATTTSTGQTPSAPGGQTPAQTFLDEVNQIRLNTQFPGLNPYDVRYFQLDPILKDVFEKGWQARYGIPQASTQFEAQRFRLPGVSRATAQLGY